jgi:RNA polymerase sigma-70 factor, ECF subfamily
MEPADPRGAAGTAEAVARQAYGKLVAWLAARTRDVAGAEDALSEAFVAALAHWPRSGIPASPEAWLVTAARRRLVDGHRRRSVEARAVADLLVLAGDEAAGDPVAVPDDRLSLMFVCAHPAIEPRMRAPLILQTLLGFDAGTIASAFLIAPATMGQRLVRAKRRIAELGLAFEVPDRDEWPERLAGVLEAIYAAFGEGWADPTGQDARLGNLAGEAIWLGRLLVALLPDEPEAAGLLALMLHTHARRFARRDADGRYVPLADQDMTRWDEALIGEAEALLARAARAGRFGRYQLEAAIQSAHVARRRLGRADWQAIGVLYDALFELTGSPVVALNRAVALAEREGAGAGLAALDACARDPRLETYQPYWAARASMLEALGDLAAAAEAYGLAIGLETDPAVRDFLQARRAALGRSDKDKSRV